MVQKLSGEYFICVNDEYKLGYLLQHNDSINVLDRPATMLL